VTAALAVVEPVDAVVCLSAAEARALTEDIRADLTSLAAKLAAAREGCAYLALGYHSHWQWLEVEFGNIADLRLPTVERRAIHGSMTEDGLSVTEIQEKTGFSRGTIHADRKALGLVADRPAPKPVNPYEGLSCPQEALRRILAAGEQGMTCAELEAATHWKHQTASPTLRRLEKRGRIRRDGRFRKGFGVYVAVTA